MKRLGGEKMSLKEKMEAEMIKRNIIRELFTTMRFFRDAYELRFKNFSHLVEQSKNSFPEDGVSAIDELERCEEIYKSCRKELVSLGENVSGHPVELNYVKMRN